MGINVYTVIVTYNAVQYIEKCLTSLAKSSIETEIVIVDNASTDETIPFIKEHYSRVHLIENKENKGFGGANNQGIEYAYSQGATHFFLCNQDVYVKEDTIENLVKIQDNYRISIVSPIHMNGDFEKCDYSFFKYFISSVHNNEFVSDLIVGELKDHYSASFVNAAAWIIDRDTIETVGGFDPVFFHYGEDANYLNRILYHGKSISVVPSAIIAHDRIFKGNLNAFNKYSLMSTIIYEHSRLDVTCFSRLKQVLTQYILLIRELVKSILKCNISQSKVIFNTLFFCIKMAPKIRCHRDMNKIINHNWLDITIVR